MNNFVKTLVILDESQTEYDNGEWVFFNKKTNTYLERKQVKDYWTKNKPVSSEERFRAKDYNSDWLIPTKRSDIKKK